MKRLSQRWIKLWLVAALLMPSPEAHAKVGKHGPDAVAVVARGKRKLSDALAIALARANEDPKKPRPVALIIDTTATMRRWVPYVVRALGQLEGATLPKTDRWSVAALGEAFSKPCAGANELAERLPALCKVARETRNTMSSLLITLKTIKHRRTVVVYLADAHFEDEFELEELIKAIQRKRHVLSVIGPEAAYNRAWNDGIKNQLERGPYRPDANYKYWPGVGRNPFRNSDPYTVWHGGDTAYPQIPYRYPPHEWDTQFDTLDSIDGLDTEALLRRAKKMLESHKKKGPKAGGIDPDHLKFPNEEEEDEGKNKKQTPVDPDAPAGVEPSDDDLDRDSPMPSSFGPYGWMRAAGMTGGRYILFSWNRSKAISKLKFDYARCNLYPPDLRARDVIQKGIAKNKIQAACLKAWHALLVYSSQRVSMTAPLAGKRLKVAHEIAEPSGLNFTLSDAFSDAKDRTEFVREAGIALRSLERARGSIAKHIPKEFAKVSPVERRIAAEGERFIHILDAMTLRLDEGIAAASSIKRSAWKDGKMRASLSEHSWLRPGRDPDDIEVMDVEKGALHNPDRAKAFLAERKRLLIRYRGVPFGEELALNRVYIPRPWTYEITDDDIELPMRGRTRTESSDGGPPPPTSGGNSSGGGPTTGN